MLLVTRVSLLFMVRTYVGYRQLSNVMTHVVGSTNGFHCLSFFEHFIPMHC